MSDLNIYQRMSAITSELQTVAKNLSIQSGKTSYKAVSERDIIDAVKPLEIKHGVYSYPASRRVLESSLLESENEYQGKVTKKTTFYERIETIYRFVNVDDPMDFIDTITFAEGIDTQDKGSGKAMTYADKYALMKAYKISTGDDPDQEASKEERYTRRSERTPQALICQCCGNQINDSYKRDGSVWSAGDIAQYTKIKFGAPMCVTCATTKKNEN